MRNTRFVLPLLMLVLTAWACAWFTPAVPTPEIPTAAPTEAAIGTVTRIETNLRQGPDENSLTSVEGINPLTNGDFLQVTEGGKGLLDFGDAIRITIFNDTNLGNIQTEAAPGTSLKVSLLLQKGGFLGTVNPGQGAVAIDTPNNGSINVVGTTFFVLFDQAAGTTVIGNFDGIVDVISGGVQVSLSPGYYLEFAGGAPGSEIPILFTPADFEQEADLLNSPISGFTSLTRNVPPDDAKRISPAEIAKFFLDIGGCSAAIITDGSPVAEADAKIFTAVFTKGGCVIVAQTVILPGADMETMVAVLEAIEAQGTPYILYYPIDQPTADLLFDVIHQFKKFVGSWLVDAAGIRQEGFPIVE